MTGSRWMGWIAGGAIALVAVLAAAGGCTPIRSGVRPPDASPSAAAATQTPRMPDAATTVLGGDEASLALAASRTLYEQAEVVVLSDASAVPLASGVAARLAAPALIAPADDLATATAGGRNGPGAELVDELRRLHAATVVAVGSGATTWIAAHRGEAGIRRVVAGLESALLPVSRADSPLSGLTVVVLPGASAARATAEAAGADVIEVHDADPRRTAADVTALTGRSLDRVLAIGDAFGPADRLRTRLETAATGVQLPGGGETLFPGRRLVALYGSPYYPALGALGEQDLGAAIARVQGLAAEYQAAFGETVVPAFEIIATVATSGPGPDGDYSAPTSVDALRPWVDAARDAGLYVVLDLQAGRTDFLTQARLYEPLLTEPNVGLALDPEWRLAPNERPIRDVGEVDASEVNAVGAWLDGLTAAHRLPQKLLIVHQWLKSMITNRASLVTGYDDLAVVIHVDGFGGTGSKLQTWASMLADAPAGVSWGWKNFIDEDTPMLTPEQTVAQVHPSPVFISYQ